MEAITLIGLFAGFLTSGAAYPQAIKTWKTKKTNDLSLIMYSMVFSGICIWLVYGFIIIDFPIIFSNLLALFPVGYVFFSKLKYG